MQMGPDFRRDILWQIPQYILAIDQLCRSDCRREFLRRQWAAKIFPPAAHLSNLRAFPKRFCSGRKDFFGELSQRRREIFPVSKQAILRAGASERLRQLPSSRLADTANFPKASRR